MSSLGTGSRYKRDTTLKFSEGTVDQYKSFRTQFNITQEMLNWNLQKAGVELYMSLEGKAAIKVESVVRNAKGKPNIAEMWKALNLAFLPID